MITVYVGDVGEYLSTLCHSVDPDAKLITHKNFANLVPGTYYTSIADLNTLLNFSAVLRQADKIVYAPPTQWSDQHKKTSKMQHWTEDYLDVFRFKCQVENFEPRRVQIDKDVVLNLVDQRRSQHTQLWIAGCSFSHGIGVTEQTRYGQLLANQLNIPASFLTCPESSIVWAADQILRSDIRSGDIVVWGITSWSRTPFFIDNVLSHVTANSLAEHSTHHTLINADTLDSDHLFYQSLISIFQVITFCQQIDAKLVIASLLDDCISEHLKDQSNFIMLFKLWGREYGQLFADLGSNGFHPGPITHQFYADQIYKKLQDLLAYS
jgi:hypothetical protein